ncbi:MAG: DUF2520 domain-containing protein [Proteobacteria bacterium]|nr:DUF2520 domain-containing protein [Pseudomonadota bacterium]
MMKPTIAIAGCGKVGTTFGNHLSGKGYAIKGISCRTLPSAQAAARLLNTANFSVTPWEITGDADVVFIATPDGKIQENCEEIAKHHGFKKGAIVFHCSGSQPSTILASAEKEGAITGSLHPLQSFASVKLTDNPFKGIIMAAEGAPLAMGIARNIAAELESVFIEIRTDAKTLYHASAVVASNYLVALIGFSFDLINEAGISEKDAMSVLRPLIKGTLDNIEKVGVVNALTGPIVRGDVSTVTRHLDQIRERQPGLVDMYKILGRYAVGLTKKRNELDPQKINELVDLLK